jgi:hypothetical protein
MQARANEKPSHRRVADARELQFIQVRARDGGNQFARRCQHAFRINLPLSKLLAIKVD